MNKTIVHHERVCSLERTGKKVKLAPAVIKIGLDVHARLYVAVAQYDQLLPKAARRFALSEFVPWWKDCSGWVMTWCMWFTRRAG
jgi:hypothetical protein